MILFHHEFHSRRTVKIGDNTDVAISVSLEDTRVIIRRSRLSKPKILLILHLHDATTEDRLELCSALVQSIERMEEIIYVFASRFYVTYEGSIVLDFLDKHIQDTRCYLRALPTNATFVGNEYGITYINPTIASELMCKGVAMFMEDYEYDEFETEEVLLDTDTEYCEDDCDEYECDEYEYDEFDEYDEYETEEMTLDTFMTYFEDEEDEYDVLAEYEYEFDEFDEFESELTSRVTTVEGSNCIYTDEELEVYGYNYNECEPERVALNALVDLPPLSLLYTEPLGGCLLGDTLDLLDSLEEVHRETNHFKLITKNKYSETVEEVKIEDGELIVQTNHRTLVMEMQDKEKTDILNNIVISTHQLNQNMALEEFEHTLTEIFNVLVKTNREKITIG